MSDKNMDNNPSPLKSFFGMVLFGSIFMIVGTVIVLFSVDVIKVSDDGFNAPRWVVAIAGGFFIVAGMMPMLESLKQLSGGESFWFRAADSLVRFLFLLLLAVPFNWVAFGPGEREFSSAGSLGPLAIFRQGLSAGRCVFGIAAMLINLMVIYVAGSSVRKLIFPDADKNEAV